MSAINEMCGKLEQYSLAEFNKNKEQINTKELGEVVDMMKDLSEMKKNKAEADYYCALVEAMEDAEYGVDYDYEGRLGRNGKYYQDTMPRSNRRGYGENTSSRNSNRMNDMSTGRMGYDGNSNGRRTGSRYGYSHDEYMEAKHMYSPSDPEGKIKRMEMLDDYMDDLTDSAKELISDMTPEEKQAWKIKLSKIINM